jgi:aminobenzoyl-glutamate transport protein
MPHFPLIVIVGQPYCKRTGIGTVISKILPYTVILHVVWTAFLVAW